MGTSMSAPLGPHVGTVFHPGIRSWNIAEWFETSVVSGILRQKKESARHGAIDLTGPAVDEARCYRAGY